MVLQYHGYGQLLILSIIWWHFSFCIGQSLLLGFHLLVRITKLFFGIFSWKEIKKTNEKFIDATQFFFPLNQFIVKFFSKTLIWRNFCEKTMAVKFRDFHCVKKREIHCHTNYFSSNLVKSWFDGSSRKKSRE